MNTSPATYAAVFDASQVRMAEMAAAYDVAVRNGDASAAHALLRSVLDLAMGNEQLARSVATDLDGAAVIAAYLQETYSLLSMATDPFLRSLLPVIPETGVILRPRAFVINGGIPYINGKGGYADATLSPL